MSVLTYFTALANQLTLSETEKSNIDRSIATLKGRLRDHFGSDLQDQLRFGSSTRGTILPRKADERSDIDYMVIFKNPNGFRPQTFLSKLKAFSDRYYTTSEIFQSHPTIVLQLNHIKFDLVPAYEDFWGKKIPASTSSFQDWTTTYPNDFNDRLTSANQRNNSNLKPMIRLIKYWNSLNGYIYDSYSLEQHLIESSYWSSYNLKDYFFSAINDLPTRNLTAVKSTKVSRAQDQVRKIKTNEDGGWGTTAEQEARSFLPTL
jgi:hypothetical protein